MFVLPRRDGRTSKATALSGIVEVDETYFLKLQKGAHKVESREARKRGGRASKPGLSGRTHSSWIVHDRTGGGAMLEKVSRGTSAPSSRMTRCSSATASSDAYRLVGLHTHDLSRPSEYWGSFRGFRRPIP